MKVLIGVYNISGYLLAEVRELCKRAEVTIVETECCLSDSAHANFPQVKFVRRTEMAAFPEMGVGDLFLCAGWSDMGFVALARQLKKQGVTTVLAIDTPWQGKLRQCVHALYTRFTLTRVFDYGFGAGAPQARHLRILGFPRPRIRCGYYSADDQKFSVLAQLERKPWPHNFIYVGRYVDVKNMDFMLKCFITAIEEMPESDWSFNCIGGGNLFDNRVQHQRINHLGYKKPYELQNFIGNSGCFVLASTYEPWGVVVHEFAIAGLPMLCSNLVMSCTAYLQEGKNGFAFDPHDARGLVEAYKKIMRMSDAELESMGKISHRLGMTYTTEDWVNSIMEMAAK